VYCFFCFTAFPYIAAILEKKNPNSETVLVVALKKGDIQAFDKLFADYGKRLYYFAFCYLKSKEEAEGVVQEVFLRIWRNRKKLKPDLSFRAYLFKIAYHQILEILRHNNCTYSYQNEIIEEAVGLKNNMDERLNYQLVLERVDELIARLPPRQQEIIILRKKEGVPVKEIARRFDISPKTVENHLTEALKKIKNGLGEKFVASLFY